MLMLRSRMRVRGRRVVRRSVTIQPTLEMRIPTAAVYVFIGKLLSCLAKRKTIFALCVPACRLQHTLGQTERNR